MKSWMMDSSVHQPDTSVWGSAQKEQSVLSLKPSIDPTAKLRINSCRKVKECCQVLVFYIE